MSKNNIHVLSRAVIIDDKQILLCKTLDLAKGFYFLPGGHVEHGESVEDTLIRELIEESGVECKIQRFLGCLEYSFEPRYSSICHSHEYNFVFEVKSDLLKSNYKIPQIEPHIELIWMPMDVLSEIDFRAEPFKKLIPEWLNAQSSGTFNSVMI